MITRQFQFQREIYGIPVISLPTLLLIHSQNLIYRDVKPEKILISENSVMKWSSDFGISRAVAAGQPYFDQSKFTGSERWLANEIIDTSQANRLFNFTLMSGSIKCDTFALGCIFFFYLSSGIHPFGDDYNIQENIRIDNPVNVDRKNDILIHFPVSFMWNLKIFHLQNYRVNILLSTQLSA